jgi:hypothetical protein
VSLSPDGSVTLLETGGGRLVTADGQSSTVPGTDTTQVVHLTPDGALGWWRTVAGVAALDTAADGSIFLAGARPLFGWNNQQPHNLGTWDEHHYGEFTSFVARLAGDGTPQWATPVRTGGSYRALPPDQILATDDGVVAGYSMRGVVAAPTAAGTDLATPNRSDSQVILLALDQDGHATRFTTAGGINGDELVALAPGPDGLSALVDLGSNSTVTGPGGSLAVGCTEPTCRALVDLTGDGNPVAGQSWIRPSWHPLAVGVDDGGDRFLVGPGEGVVTFFAGTPDETTIDFTANPAGAGDEVLAWFPAPTG